MNTDPWFGSDAFDCLEIRHIGGSDGNLLDQTMAHIYGDVPFASKPNELREIDNLFLVF